MLLRREERLTPVPPALSRRRRSCPSSFVCDCTDLQPQFFGEWYALDCAIASEITLNDTATTTNATSASIINATALDKAPSTMFNNVNPLAILVALVTGLAMLALISLSVLFARYRRRNLKVIAVEAEVADAQGVVRLQNKEIQAAAAAMEDIQDQLAGAEKNADQALLRRAQSAEAKAQETLQLLHAEKEAAEEGARQLLQDERAAVLNRAVSTTRERLGASQRKKLRNEVGLLVATLAVVEFPDIVMDVDFFFEMREFFDDAGMGTSFAFFFALSVVSFLANAAYHAVLLRGIYRDYLRGIEIVQSLDDDEVLYGSKDENNPFAALAKVNREIKRTVVKIALVSIAEDIPSLYFKVQLFNLKPENLDQWELMQLVKSAFMVGFIVTQLQVVYVRISERQDLERRIERIRATANRRRESIAAAGAGSGTSTSLIEAD